VNADVSLLTDVGHRFACCKKSVQDFRRYGILKDITFTVADGEFCVLLGPSGCGKLMLLRIAAWQATVRSGSGMSTTSRSMIRRLSTTFKIPDWANDGLPS